MGRAEGEVFADGLAEEEGFLAYHADVAAEDGEGVVAHRAAVDEERSFGSFIQAGDQADQGGLSAACGADDGEAGAGGNVERDVVEDRCVAVAEVEVAELDLAVQDGIGGNGGIGGAVVDGRLGLEQLVDALYRGGAALEDVDDPADGDDWPDEHDHVGAEGDELADVDAVGDDEVPAGQQGDDHGDAEDELERRPEHAHELDEAQCAARCTRG